jgi:hypothetical protein
LGFREMSNRVGDMEASEEEGEVRDWVKKGIVVVRRRR